jgi:hypothetical protein
MEKYWLQGFIKRAEERGLDPTQTEALLKQAGPGSILSRLGWAGAGAGSVLGGLALKDFAEDATKTPTQLQLEAILEGSQGMNPDRTQELLASYLEQAAKRDYNRAKDRYNL